MAFDGDYDDDVSTLELGTPYRTGHTTSLLNSSFYHAVVVHEVFAELDVDKTLVLLYNNGTRVSYHNVSRKEIWKICFSWENLV